MKGFWSLAFLAVVYILIVIILQEASADPRVPPAQPEGTLHSQGENNGIENNVPGPFVNQPEAIIGKEPGASDVKEGWNEAEAATFPQARAQPQDLNQKNNASSSTNPFADLFEISDPATKNMLEAMYGSYSGDDQCRRKAFCMMGNYVNGMPGRDFFFMLLSGYIPPEYSIFYDIFRNSALYGQNCNVYVCVPPPTAQSPDPKTAATPRPQPR